MGKMFFRVFDNNNKDVTNDFDWYIDSCGGLFFLTDDIDCPLMLADEYTYELTKEKKSNGMDKKEVREYIEWKGLLPCLTMFDNHGLSGSFSKNNWRIANGGYDCWFELYYNDTPIVDCVAGELSAWGLPQEVLDEICRRIINKFPHLKMEKVG